MKLRMYCISPMRGTRERCKTMFVIRKQSMIYRTATVGGPSGRAFGNNPNRIAFQATARLETDSTPVRNTAAL